MEAASTRPGRQADILKTFTEMVAEHGYDLTSVSDIASALNMSKGTIMYHFGSKDRLLQQMSLEYMHRRISELQMIIDSGEPSPSQIGAVVMGLMVGFRDDRAATIAFSREFMRFASDPVMEKVIELRRQYVEMTSSIIIRGIELGELRPVDPELTTLQMIGMCNWSWTWFRPDGPATPEQLGKMFSEALLNGITAS